MLGILGQFATKIINKDLVQFEIVMNFVNDSYLIFFSLKFASTSNLYTTSEILNFDKKLTFSCYSICENNLKFSSFTKINQHRFLGNDICKN